MHDSNSHLEKRVFHFILFLFDFIKVEVVEGKLGTIKHLFELKLEELPCPEPSREDLMASEQPSSRHEHAHMGSTATTIALPSAMMYLFLSQFVVLGVNNFFGKLHFT